MTTFADLTAAIGGTREQHWVPAALCAQTDPDIFYPDKGDTTAAAKRVCGACPVRSECLQYALDTDQEWGVWGGLSETERRGRKPRPSDLVPEKRERDEEIMRRVSLGESSATVAAGMGVALVTVKRVRARFAAASQSTVTEAA